MSIKHTTTSARLRGSTNSNKGPSKIVTRARADIRARLDMQPPAGSYWDRAPGHIRRFLLIIENLSDTRTAEFIRADWAQLPAFMQCAFSRAHWRMHRALACGTLPEVVKS